MTQPLTAGAFDAPVPPALVVERALRRGRLSVAFRWLLVIPQAFVLELLLLVAVVVLVLGWLAALVMGRLPEPFARYLSHVIRYNTRVNAYLWLLTDRYPPFRFLAQDYPVQLDLAPGRLNRLAVLFRVFLAIPAAILAGAATVGVAVASFFIWLLVLVIGRVPGALFDALTAVLRYSTRLNAYYWLLTSAYPGGLLGDQPPPAVPAPSPATAPPPTAPPPPPAEPAAPASAAPAPPPTAGSETAAGPSPAVPAEQASPVTATLPGPPEPPGPPTAPRGWLVLSAAARRLVIFFVVLGVVSYVAGGVVQAFVGFSSVSNAQVLADVTAAHDELVGQGQKVQQKISACGSDASALPCIGAADRELAAAFETFTTRIDRMEFPAPAKREAAEVSAVARRFAGALRLLGAATTPEEYTKLAQGEINQLGSLFDQRYEALVNKLSA